MRTEQTVTDRWDRAGEVAAYGAALAITPYLVIKVSWVVGALAGVLPTGDHGMRTSEWVALNVTTIVMAGVGIAVALALVRPWGRRIPARLLVAGSWIGAGFLVPLLPYAIVGLVDLDGGSMPDWEAALIQAGFVGMGLGLAVALPAYFRRRWPAHLSGRLGDRRLPPGMAVWSIAAAAGLAVVWTYWVVGGDLGLVHPDERVATWRVLNALYAAWALAAAAAVWCLMTGRPAHWPRWVPMTVAWLGSGSLFAWSAWKLPLMLYVAAAEPAEPVLIVHIEIETLLHACGIIVGASMLRMLVGLRSDR